MILVVILSSVNATQARSDERNDADRLEDEVSSQASEINTIADVRRLAERITQLQKLQSAYPDNVSWKRRSIAVIKKDVERIVSLDASSQEKVLEAWYSVRQALVDFRAGKREESVTRIARSVADLNYLLGEGSYYALVSESVRIGMLNDWKPSRDVSKLAECNSILYSKTYGIDHPYSAIAIELQGMTSLQCNDWRTALRFFDQAIRIREKIYGTNTTENAGAELGTMMALIGLEDFKSAKVALGRFGTIHKRATEINGRVRTDYHNMLMRVAAHEGRLQDAEIAERVVLTSLLSYMPEDAPIVREQIRLLHTILVKQGKKNTARAIEFIWKLPPYPFY